MNVSLRNGLYLLTLCFVVSAPARADDSVGKAAFERICAMCHGESGEGAEGPPLVPLKYGAPEILGFTRNGRGNMPPQPRSAITNDEITAVAAYLGTLGAAAKK